MSASAIADGFVSIFSSASPFGSTTVTKNDYAIMETTACAIIVQSVRNQSGPEAYGQQRMQNRTFFLDMWLKETGNPQTDLNNLLAFQDEVEYVLNTNPTVGGMVKDTNQYRIERDPETVWVYGGQQWFRLFGEVDCWELL